MGIIRIIGTIGVIEIGGIMESVGQFCVSFHGWQYVNGLLCEVCGKGNTLLYIKTISKKFLVLCDRNSNFNTMKKTTI